MDDPKLLNDVDSLPLGSVIVADGEPTLLTGKSRYVSNTIPTNSAERVNLWSKSIGFRDRPLDIKYTLPAADFDIPKWRHAQIAQTAFRIGMTPGADPEFFVNDGADNIIPAWEFLPQKERPLNLASDYGEAYWDGLQAEWRITQPQSGCLDVFTKHLRSCALDLIAVAQTKFPKARLDIRSVIDVEPSLLRNELEQHLAFGCLGSENVYGIKGRTDENPREVPIRFAGGHMHFGLSTAGYRWSYSRAIQQEIVGAVKMLDAVVGVALVSMSEDYDDVRRREYYGLAGEYRLPKHGLEYRVPSNFWLCARPIAYLVWDLARMAVCAGCMGLRDAYDATDAEVIAAINGNDVKLARTILRRNEDVFRKWLGWYENFAGPYASEMAWETLLGGPEVVGIDPANILANWPIDGRWTQHALNVYHARSLAAIRAKIATAQSEARPDASR